MIALRCIGLSVCQRGLQAVALKKFRQRTQIVAWEERPWPSACLNPEFAQLNVLAEEPFVSTVREALKSLGAKKCSIALSLSDNVGITMITTLNEPLKRGQEGINLLKWQLRDQLPLEPEKIRLAYQLIDSQKGGGSRVLVTAVNNEVLAQYEHLLAEAGATPALVLFESLSLMNYHHSHGISKGDHLLLTLSDDTLTLQLFCDAKLQAQRSRPAPASEKVLYQEITRTLANWEETWPQSRNLPAYLHATAAANSWQETVADALGRPLQTAALQPLPMARQLMDRPLPMPDFCSTIGAAEGLGRGFL